MVNYIVKKKKKGIIYNKMYPNYMSGAYVFTFRHVHYNMHLTAFLCLLNFLNDFVFLSFIVINWRSGSRFGLCNGLESQSQCQFVYKDGRRLGLTLPKLVSALYKSTR